MNHDQIKSFYPLSLSVRSLFHKMGNAVTLLHDGSGIFSGMRAVMESLVMGGAKTVPEIARVRPVSRQHIQILVNDLLALGYVEYQDNPAHRRSKLVAVTDAGEAAFKAFLACEVGALSMLSLDIPLEELESAERVLSQLISRFQSAEWHSIVEDLSPNSKE
jgi:DNA-binding MarR family transcriptional regulator